MKPPSRIPLLLLEGSPLERGRAHGETFRSGIRDLIVVWKSRLHKDTGIDPDRYLAAFLADTDFQAAAERWTPGLLAEVRGIAEGAGIDFQTMFAHQLADEEWWYREKGFNASGPPTKRCSAVGISGGVGYSSLLAQTLDLPDFYSGYLTVLHIKYPGSDLEMLVVTPLGVIASNGLNNYSVGVCANTLSQLDPAPDGLPVDFVVRGALEQTTLAGAAAFLGRVKHASGQNYLIGGPDAVLDYECSANQIHEFSPYPGASRVCHTNHPLISDDQGVYRQRLGNLAEEDRVAIEKQKSNTETRLRTLIHRLQRISDPPTVDSLKQILSSHDSVDYPICRHKRPGDDSVTAAAEIMELSDSPVIHVAAGPPCSTPFHPISMK